MLAYAAGQRYKSINRMPESELRKMKKAMLALWITLSLSMSCLSALADVPVAGKKVAYIINMAESDIFTQCAEGFAQTAEKLGMMGEAFFSGGDDARFKSLVTTCAEQGFDGLFLSHGGEDYAYGFLSGLLARYPKLKLVTFDTRFVDASGCECAIPGVTQFFQDDAGLAESLLHYACAVIAPDQRPVKVLKVWVGDYIAAFDRRDVGYQKYEADGRIVTVETIAPADFADAEASMHAVMKQTLTKYDEADIDVVWVAYDAYARGCYRAIMESEKRIPLVSVDICGQDAEYMLAADSVWKACACTDFRANGEQGARILALELAGEYGSIVDQRTGAPTAYIEMPATLITAEHLSGGDDTLLSNAPDSYGDVKNYVTCDWLRQSIGY